MRKRSDKFSKILNDKQLLEIVARFKKGKKKIVTFNGSFDILHAGHISAFQEARAQGDFLFVLLNSDRSIKKYKGSSRPIIDQKNRAKMLIALESVDFVTIFDEINPKKILSKIKPDVHCNGSNWGKNCLERAVVENNGGKIHILKSIPGVSTSLIIEKILRAYSNPPVKAVFLDRDGTINHNRDGYIHRIEDFEFLPGVISALKKLSRSDYKIIVINGQSGIGRGYYSEKQFKKLNNWFLKTVKQFGGRIDKVYYCPHHPDNGCICRKPGIGMLLESVKDFNISLNDSWVIGDDDRDIIMGREANIKTIKLGRRMKGSKLQPHFYASNLLKAVNLIRDRQ